jgi:phosphohistidine phosphatase
MEIYLLRHGTAEHAAPGGSDANRRLTEEGREELRRVLERARRAGVKPALILSSPLARAIETAQLAGGILGYQGGVVQTRALVPEARPEEVWAELRERRDENAVLLAGHEPLFSYTTAYLLGCPALQLVFEKGALLRVDIDKFGGEPRGVLRWMLTPDLSP